MPHMPDFFDEVERDAAAIGHGITGLFHHHHAADAAPRTPATRPATITVATAAAPPQEDTMSLATIEEDLRNGVTAVKNEIGKFEQNLPAIVADVKAVTGTPLGQLAVAAAQHVAAGVLPPEALAIVESGAQKLYGDILSLYNPQGAAGAAPTGQQPVQQGAPAGQ